MDDCGTSGKEEVSSHEPHEKVQKSEESQHKVSENASRALASVDKKLSSNLSVETTVNQLIMDAIDLENLGSIFCGEFGAWLRFQNTRLDLAY